MTPGIFPFANWEWRFHFRRMWRRMSLRLLLMVPAIGIALTGAALGAAEGAGNPVLPDRFSQHNWSQIVPNRDYLHGCVTGYRAFQFNQLGYFIFDRTNHGSWRVDSRGNLVLHTRDGITFTLIYDGHDTLISPHTNKVKFLGPIDRFRECPE